MNGNENENDGSNNTLDTYSKRVVKAVALSAAAIFLCNATMLILVYFLTS